MFLKTDKTKSCQGCGKIGHSHIVSGNVKWFTFANSPSATLGNSLVVPFKFQCIFRNHTSTYLPKRNERKKCTHKSLYWDVFSTTKTENIPKMSLNW